MTSGASVPQPPAVARALLKLMLPRGILRESVVGDLDQEFSRRAGHTGIPALRRWYRREALSLAAYGLRCRMAPRRPGRRDRGGRNRIGRAQWRRPLELLTDLQHAARALRKHPGPVVLTVLSLALGIGATTTMLSVVDAIDFRPLPYGDAARIVEMSRTSPVTGEAGYPASPGLFRDWQERTRSYEALAAATIIAAAFGDEGAENLSGARVTEDFFPTLKVAPILGRTFTPEEVRQGARVLMISYDGWRTVFGGDRDVIGQTARVSWAGEFRTVPAEPFTVVGVLPPGAQYPRGSDVWLPAADSLGGMITVVGRVRPEVSLAGARAEMARISAQLPGTGVVTPLREAVRARANQRAASARFLLLAIAGFVLLLAIINASVVFIIRAGRQEHDLRIRAALGAPRSRLVGLMLGQGLIVSLVAGGLGVLLSFWGIRLADLRLAVSSTGLSPVFDGRVVAAAGVVSVVAGIMLGVLPASRYGRVDRRGSLLIRVAGVQRAGPGGRAHGFLVMAQVACALVLLHGAGFLARDLLRTTSRELGFEGDRLLVAGLQGVVTTQRAVEVADRMAGLPGVVGVAIGGMPANGYVYRRDNGDSLPGLQDTQFRRVSADYFGTLRIPLLAGRAFQPTDRDGSPPVAIVSRMAARAWWPGESPVGKTLFMGTEDGAGEWVSIVGMSADERVDRDMRAEMMPILYRPWRQLSHEWRRTEVFARTAAEPAGLIPQVRTVLRELRTEDGWQGDYVVTMDEILGSYLNLQRFRTSALSVFSLFALVLASMGIYGVVATVVHQRTAEIGIRLALGARSQDVLALVARTGLGLAVAGVVLGGLAAFGAHRVLTSLVVTATGFEPLSMVVAGVCLGGGVFAACYVPGRRATRIDPTTALRE